MGSAPGAVQAQHVHVVHAFDTLVHQLSEGEQVLPDPEFDNIVCPLFVTWNKASKHGGDVRLRGCIGTFEPRSLHQGLRDYAITSALKDRRFSPISLSELRSLQCTVSLLHSFEPGASWDDWDIGVHGVIIEFPDPVSSIRRSATFLPEIAAHERWDKAQTLEHLVRKAGCGVGTAVSLRKVIKLTRYQSTACSLTYDEYKALKEPRMFRKGAKAEHVAAAEEVTVPAG